MPVTPTTQLVLLDPRQLRVDPDNIRIRKDQGNLESLAESIGEHGVLQPLGVIQVDGYHQVVFGNRRREAAILAGLDRVPCVILPTTDDDDVLVLQILENVQREDLNDLEKAEAFARLRRRLATKYDVKGEQARDELVAKALGINERTVRRYLSLRELVPAVRDLVADGELTVTQAQHLRALTPAARQEAMAHFAVERGLTAAQISRTVTLLVQNPNLTIEMALRMADRDDSVPPASGGDAPVPVAAPAPAAPVAPVARPATAPIEDPDDDSDLWDDDPEEPDELGDPPGTVRARQPDTADRSRVFRIHSVDAFADLVERLGQCIRDGDITSLADQDAAAPMKLRLVLRQMEAVTKDLRLYLNRRQWAD
jgi:ParB family chromosome partitioning protein